MTKKHSSDKLFCWLISCVTVLSLAPQAAAQSATSPRRLQSLVNDTAKQFQLAYRSSPAERQRSHEQLAAVVANWRTAPRSDPNDGRLAEWLRAAMRSAMPGSRTGLPPAPMFDREVIESRPAATLPGDAAAPPPADKSTGDPFGDDPVAEEL